MKFIEIDNHIINVDHIIEIWFTEGNKETNRPQFEIIFESAKGLWTTYYKTIERQHEDYTRIFKFLAYGGAKDILELKKYNKEEVKEKE